MLHVFDFIKNERLDSFANAQQFTSMVNSTGFLDDPSSFSSMPCRCHTNTQIVAQSISVRSGTFFGLG